MNVTDATDVTAPKTEPVEKKITIDEYLKEKFPLATGEYQVDYKPVGETRFRINFWSYVEDDESRFMRASRITRSHYVILKKDGLSWSHRIW